MDSLLSLFAAGPGRFPDFTIAVPGREGEQIENRGKVASLPEMRYKSPQ
jgi:hypothetical protein